MATEGKIIDEKLVKEKLLNPLLKLEDTATDLEKKRLEMPRLIQNIQIREKFKDDYKANALMRKKFREEKKEIEKTGVLFADSDEKVALKQLDANDLVGGLLLRSSLSARCISTTKSCSGKERLGKFLDQKAFLAKTEQYVTV